MFQKVLIADDLDSINHGVQAVARRAGIPEVVQVQYCDDAYLRVKRAGQDGEPFGLLITDLSFKSDHRAQTYSSGEALIRVLREEHPDLKIMVYSIEDRPRRVQHFFKSYAIDGWVSKGRRGMEELESGIHTLAEGRTYVSPHIEAAMQHGPDLEVEEYDIELIRLLSEGLSQEEISLRFKENGVRPSSLSSIEKRLNTLRIKFGANNAIHLVARAKDLGLV